MIEVFPLQSAIHNSTKCCHPWILTHTRSHEYRADVLINLDIHFPSFNPTKLIINKLTSCDLLFKNLPSSLVQCSFISWQDTSLHIHIFSSLLTAFFCNPQKSRGKIKVALYNITADPNERQDLSRKFPDMVETLRKRVRYYNKSEMPSRKKRHDPKAMKLARKNGFWGPWIDWDLKSEKN